MAIPAARISATVSPTGNAARAMDEPADEADEVDELECDTPPPPPE